MKSEIGQESKFDNEEQKKQSFPEHGLELWGIGYVSSDHEDDEDEGDLEEDPDEAAENEELRERILRGEEFEMNDFETISNTTRLREVYNYRWWKDTDPDNYFVMVNKNTKSILPGEQLYYNYGRRSNAYLLQK